jgi:hypothetical protein
MSINVRGKAALLLSQGVYDETFINPPEFYPITTNDL